MAILLIGLLAIFAPASRAAEPAGFTLVTHNILFCDPKTSETLPEYTERLGREMITLRTLAPDILLLQEVANCHYYAVKPDSVKDGALMGGSLLGGGVGGGANLAGRAVRSAPVSRVARTIARGLHFKDYWWRSEGIPSLWEEGLAILWNPETVKVTSLHCRHLKTTKYGVTFTITKSICRARATLKDGKTIWIYNTHLDTDEAYSLPQLQEALDLIQAEVPPGAPVIFAGDFNNKRGSAATQRVIDAGFTSAVSHEWDHVFYRNLGYSFFGERVAVAKDVSDHDALRIRLQLPPSGTR